MIDWLIKKTRFNVNVPMGTVTFWNPIDLPPDSPFYYRPSYYKYKVTTSNKIEVDTREEQDKFVSSCMDRIFDMQLNNYLLDSSKEERKKLIKHLKQLNKNK